MEIKWNNYKKSNNGYRVKAYSIPGVGEVIPANEWKKHKGTACWVCHHRSCICNKETIIIDTLTEEEKLLIKKEQESMATNREYDWSLPDNDIRNIGKNKESEIREPTEICSDEDKQHLQQELRTASKTLIKKIKTPWWKFW